ncbi:MAG TPA: diacylglycerol kinase family protein [Herpetosiphonaceae bacterium]
MQTCVILNPHAGSVEDVKHVEAAVQRLGDLKLLTTARPGDGLHMAREAVEQGCEFVVAAGGDGTINEVVNGLAQHFDRAVLGVLPVGTGNDFARSIGVPTEIDAAVELLARRQTRSLDVVRVTSDEVRYFINVSAGGFSGLVDEKLTEDLKRSWGPLAYLRSAAEALPDLTDYHTSITFDDDEQHEVKTYNIVIANARYVAGGIPIAPEALLDDGLVDVLVVPAASMPQLALLVPQVLLGQHLTSDLISFRRARKVRIESRPGMWFNADGELVGNQPATFEVLPKALQVAVGTPAA